MPRGGKCSKQASSAAQRPNQESDHTTPLLQQFGRFTLGITELPLIIRQSANAMMSAGDVKFKQFSALSHTHTHGPAHSNNYNNPLARAAHKGGEMQLRCPFHHKDVFER
jgi:hypothetical protein